MALPHDSWANVYDFVYENTFGPNYTRFTDITLSSIQQISENGTILDFGSGTGRLAIPLKMNGYDVIAIEKSEGMAAELTRKCALENLDIPIFNCQISDYQNGEADMVLAVFTVLSYCTSEDELRNSLTTISSHVKSNGYFLFDIPNRIFFPHNHQQKQIIDIDKVDFKRYVTLDISDRSDVYFYNERCEGVFNGNKFQYNDQFLIRYWDINHVNSMLEELGMKDTHRVFAEFAGTGSTYKLYQKTR